MSRTSEDPSFWLQMQSSAPSSGAEGESELDVQDQVTEPKLFKVLLLNDDFTPMDFVVLVLTRFFGKDMEQATAIMLKVHEEGAGIAGVYSFEVAETKVLQVNQFAKKNEHPLKCVMEEDNSC